ncbi:hypothetical protein SESBI_21147 [Sesbania bispinosa]|nr:hypothetical protein SESBI_21147 [Sesbania bispinosa]
MEKCLKELCDDEDAMEMSKILESKKCDVYLYVEHIDGVGGENGSGDLSAMGGSGGSDFRNRVLNVQGERQEGDGIVGDVSLAEEDIYFSDELVKGAHFDDSEEEKDMGDDGFNLPVVGAAEVALNEEL